MWTSEISALLQWTDIFQWPRQDAPKSCMNAKFNVQARPMDLKVTENEKFTDSVSDLI